MINQTVNLSELTGAVASGLTAGQTGFLISTRGGEPRIIDGIVTVGRDPECGIPLSDPYVSTRHCQFEKRPLGFFVRDLKSRNGVFLNGLRVAEGQLLDGTEIQIGSTHFIFQTKAPEKPNGLPIRSKNPQWAASIETLPSVAATELPVYLEGESGTGKEILAHIVHDYSPRCERPLISVNCSALSESLVESELFGHVKGSFTGATGDRKGAFEAARGGTLFLDEIGDLPLSLQPKLLRALENQEIRPVGSDKTVSTDVRIITATHKNLERLVSEGKFRADLYFRIHVVKITLPALRERPEDFEDLLYHFCREMRVRFSVAAIEALKKHSWPGNVRELKNTVARAKALFPSSQIQPEQVRHLVHQPPPPPVLFADVPKPLGGSILKEVEKEMIRSRLLANNGNQRQTAAELGIPKSTLHDRIKAYQIEVTR